MSIKEKILENVDKYIMNNNMSISKIIDKTMDLTLIEVEKIIDEEINDFKKDKSNVEEKYRNVIPTKENQELRINATLSTLNSIKGLISGDRSKK